MRGLDLKGVHAELDSIVKGPHFAGALQLAASTGIYVIGAIAEEVGAGFDGLVVAPSHLKDYRNPHLSLVWYEAQRMLRQATKVVFVGYSLPDDDVEVV
ncbi:MAG TPA: hypothetical protein VEL28_22860 [Candidatus Binatia bacterium]|nr:hypothetical protein [Candidatus Binatia bacterium]